MKLRVRFLQLPISFDAVRLAQEVSAIPEIAWRPHPKKFAGNDAIPLITAGGEAASDARGGVMRPTPQLLACPYLMQALDALGATWGRSRLMRLSGASEVTPHVDTDYYWRDRMRVHVPIVTQPTVRFLCGGEQVHMAAGETWLFDTWSLHSVHNDATRKRIHLVADTVGGDGLLDLIENGRAPQEPRTGWTPALVAAREGVEPDLAYESCNLPKVMTPWELRDHLGFLLREIAASDPRKRPIDQALNRLRVRWHALWARSGDAETARPEYAALIADARARMTALGADKVALGNGMSLELCLRAMIFNVAVDSDSDVMDADERHQPVAAPQQAPRLPPKAPTVVAGTPRFDPVFDRPIFIVSPPRSGSSLLFETLAGARDLFTIGGEAHGLIEAIPDLTPAACGWESNRLTAAEADPATVAAVRERFAAAARDRDGRRPNARPFRLLEKTPKNALRIPFLAAAFPEGRFVYLYRDPGPTLASMMEAWISGAFRTYPQLPGWSGLPWSLLLIPEWRDLVGAPLNHVVARQWATTTRILLEDLKTLPPERRCAVRYDDLVAAPQACVAGLCAALDVVWDRTLGPNLPQARNGLTAPSPSKWKAKADVITAVADIFEAQNAMALEMLL